MKGMGIMFIVMLLSLAVAAMWQNVPLIKDSVHTVLDPSVGVLLDFNTTGGLLLITAIIVFITTLIQKYATDQDLIKTIREEQKLVQQEMKLARDNPEKTMELSKKSLELTMKTMPITMRPLMYTIIPFVLFLRWFNDYFTLNPVKIFGFLSWFWAYLIFSIFFSIIFRKLLKVV